MEKNIYGQVQMRCCEKDLKGLAENMRMLQFQSLSSRRASEKNISQA